jgi:hypothetical protein
MIASRLNASAENKTPRELRGVFEAFAGLLEWEGVFDARTLDHSLVEGLTAPLTPCKVVED